MHRYIQYISLISSVDMQISYVDSKNCKDVLS